MTPNDLIKLALKSAGVLGVGQTASAEDTTDALAMLNMMLAQWSQRRWVVPHLVEVALPATGATSYTVGPGGQFDVARPTSIAAAFLRQLTQAAPYRVDTPLDIIRSYEEWAGVAVKQQPGFSQFVFLDTAAPLAKLYVWPVPSNLNEVHLVLKPSLGTLKLDTAIPLPDEYQEAIFYNLAGRLRPAYGMGPDPTVSALAEASLNTIRNANAQIPTLEMPAALGGGGGYNVYTDRYR